MSELSVEDDLRLKEFYADFRAKVDEDAAEGDGNTLCITVDSIIWATSRRCFVSNDPHRHFDSSLHMFCYTVIQAAKSYNAGNPMQERLVYHIMYAREMGTLTRPLLADNKSSVPIPLAQTSDGSKIWSDLPFLAQYIRETWTRDSLSMSTKQRENFASFIARLASVRICGDGITGCAIWLFREALETPRRLTAWEDSSEVPVAELLPALNGWLTFASRKLLSLVNQSYSEFSPEESALGELAQKAGLAPGGFNPSRWAFWRSRFEAIVQSSQEEVKKEALSGLEMMRAADGFEDPKWPD
ncbi:hypothetical protein MMC30_004036 [Trapelia coarctata]|nr:hypothetical protein [Trapelia coarctata]